MQEPYKLIGYTILLFGALSLFFSIFYEHTVLAFIGLGLTFWGALLLYIRSENYVKAKLLNSTMIPTLANMDKILTELGYQGKAVYLPPKYLKDPETSARL
jgi:hypothetical protein